MKNIKQKLLALTLIGIMVCTLTGCPAGSSDYSSIETSSSAYDSSFAGGTSLNGMSSDSTSYSKSEYQYETDTSYQDDTANAKTPEEEEQPADTETTYVEKKIVYNADLNAETKNIETALSDIYAALDQYKAYIEDESRDNWASYDTLYTRRSANLTIRIPSKYFNTFIQGLSNENLLISSMNKTSTDYSEYYYDKESRINSLRVQETRLLELLEKASDVSTMLQIENNLTDVRYQIESLTKELKTIDSNVQYSTITMYIREVERYTQPETEPQTFGDELKETIKDSYENFIEFLKEFLFWFIGAFPYLVILGVIIFGIVKISKKRNKKKKEKQAEILAGAATKVKKNIESPNKENTNISDKK